MNGRGCVDSIIRQINALSPFLRAKYLPQFPGPSETEVH
jgi:hypothetical protein